MAAMWRYWTALGVEPHYSVVTTTVLAYSYALKIEVTIGITIIKDDNVDNNDMYLNIQYASLSTFQYLCKHFIISVLGWRI